MAIEDSPTGVASARAAGCVVVAIPHHVPVDPAPGLHVAGSLAELSVADSLAGLAPVTAPAGRLRDVLASSCGCSACPAPSDTLRLAALAGEVRELVVFLVDGLGYHLLPAAATRRPGSR